MQQIDSLVSDLEDLKGLEVWQAEQIYTQQKLLQEKQHLLHDLSSGVHKRSNSGNAASGSNSLPLSVETANGDTNLAMYSVRIYVFFFISCGFLVWRIFMSD